MARRFRDRSAGAYLCPCPYPCSGRRRLRCLLNVHLGERDNNGSVGIHGTEVGVFSVVWVRRVRRTWVPVLYYAPQCRACFGTPSVRQVVVAMITLGYIAIRVLDVGLRYTAAPSTLTTGSGFVAANRANSARPLIPVLPLSASVTISALIFLAIVSICSSNSLNERIIGHR